MNATSSLRSNILFHINYFEQGQSLERAFALARALGADGLELRAKSPRPETSAALYLDEVERAMERHPLELISFGSPGVNLMVPGQDERDRELERAAWFYGEARRRFPLGVVNMLAGRLQDPEITPLAYERHGSAIASEEQWAQAVKGFRALAQSAGEAGWSFAFETHGLFLHDTLESTCRLVEEIDSPHVGLLWDHVNLMLFPEAPGLSEVIERAGGSLFSVHLKNLLVPPQHFLAISALEEGILNVREQVRLLRQAGFQGPWCIESPRPGDRERFAARDISYLREILASLGE